MKYPVVPFLFICFSFLGLSCSQKGDQQPRSQQQSEWRYFGENVPGDTARLFSPSVISTPRNERDLALSPNGGEIFYSLVLPSNNLSVIIYLQHDGAFWSGKQIAPFSGRYSDLEPAFTPDGQKLFFVSKRPIDSADIKPDWNIWFTSKSKSGWSEPQALKFPINGEGDEYYPSISANGNLYFTAKREDTFGAEDIYMSRLVEGEYQQPENLGQGVNSKLYEFNAYVAPDEQYLIFSSFGRADGLGGGDLYITYRLNDTTWTPARNLGPEINSDKLDYCPLVSPDGKYLFFTSQQIDPAIVNHEAKDIEDIYRLSDGIKNGFGNIYWVAFDPEKWK
jgi:Tol biopolymer transport system component